MRKLRRQWLELMAEKFRRDCERNKPETCDYCAGVSPRCQMVDTDMGAMHNKCATEIGANIYWEIDHA